MTRVISSSLERVCRSVDRSGDPPSRPGPGLLASGSSYSPPFPAALGQWSSRVSSPATVAGQRRLGTGFPRVQALCTARVSRSSSHRLCWFTAAAPFGARGHETVSELGIRGEMKMHVAHERALHDISLRALLAVPWTQA